MYMWIKNSPIHTTQLCTVYVVSNIYLNLMLGKNISFWFHIVNILNTTNNLMVLTTMFLILFNNKKQVFFLLNVFAVSFISCDYYNQQQFSIFNNINLNLMNGIMLIHPPILYTLYTLLLLVFCNTLYQSKKIKTKSVNITWNNKPHVIIVFISIFLGSYWAEQELFWGGWWSWDFVELILLNILFFMLYKYHKEMYWKKLTTILFCMFWYSILVVRFNIINSIHNFINVSAQNQYDYYTVIFICITVSIFLVNMLHKNKNKVILFLKTIISTLLLLFLWGIFSTTTNIRFIYFLLYLFFMLLFLNGCIIKQTQTFFCVYIQSFSVLGNLTQRVLLFCFKKIQKNKIEHVLVIVCFFVINQQYLVFSIDALFCFTTKIKSTKVNDFFDIFFLKNQQLKKQKTYITDPLSFMVVLNNIFEKNIITTTCLESYSYNNQQLQQVGFNLLYCTTILIILKIKVGCNYFYHKEHCFNIRI